MNKAPIKLIRLFEVHLALQHIDRTTGVHLADKFVYSKTKGINNIGREEEKKTRKMNTAEKRENNL